ncbi:hypothetical protein KFE25_000764 [Diacronema lutheri]|uniref:ADP-ribosylation factor-like protein 6-interacting protein 4 n=1 Tax=Diacronema lutheri TaxID=2081491 RepID=A0A8J5XHK2_DIALT|nr:hypothetical protein KFE25_000764 [Diacronema lutheri]
MVDESSSSSSTSSSSSGEEARRHKRSRHEHERRDKEERKEKKRRSGKAKDKGDKDKRRGSSKKSGKKHKKHSDKEKKEKKRKSDKAERRDETPHTGNLMTSWGKYGVIKDDQPEGSRYEHEFQAWLSDVKGLGAAGLAKWELEEHWKTFREDFNTCTLPDKKYYDLRKWTAAQAREAPLRKVERTVFDDEEELRRQRAESAKRREQEVSRDTLVRMGATNAIENMRAQELAKMQMQHAWRTGDVGRAEEMLKRMQPETVEEKWARLKKEARALG